MIGDGAKITEACKIAPKFAVQNVGAIGFVIVKNGRNNSVGVGGFEGFEKFR